MHETQSVPPYRVVVDRTQGSAEVRVGLCGEVDMASAVEVRQLLGDYLVGIGAAAVVFDLADVEFMDSSGLSLLVRLRSALDQAVCMRVSAAAPNVQRLFQLTGTGDLLGWVA